MVDSLSTSVSLPNPLQTPLKAVEKEDKRAGVWILAKVGLRVLAEVLAPSSSLTVDTAGGGVGAEGARELSDFCSLLPARVQGLRDTHIDTHRLTHTHRHTPTHRHTQRHA